MSTDEGHKVYFSGEEGKHEYGVGFLVHKDVVGAVLGYQPVSSRLISIRLDIIVFGIISGDFLFHIDNGMLCVPFRVASMRTHSIPSCYRNRSLLQ